MSGFTKSEMKGLGAENPKKPAPPEARKFNLSKFLKWTKAIVALTLLGAASIRWAMLESDNQTIMFGACGLLVVGCVVSVGEVLFNKN